MPANNSGVSWRTVSHHCEMPWAEQRQQWLRCWCVVFFTTWQSTRICQIIKFGNLSQNLLTSQLWITNNKSFEFHIITMRTDTSVLRLPMEVSALIMFLLSWIQVFFFNPSLYSRLYCKFTLEVQKFFYEVKFLDERPLMSPTGQVS